METRCTTSRPAKIETREDGKRVILGYAAVYFNAADAGTTYEMLPDLHERIMPGAFDRAIRERHDARALFNHDPNNILGRVGAGTLTLSADAVGLRYEIDPPPTTLAEHVMAAIERGDIAGSSFAFIPKTTRWLQQDSIDIREVVDVDLFDVGPVTYPAYESTTTGLRSEAGIAALAAERDEIRRKRTATAEAIYRYLQL